MRFTTSLISWQLSFYQNGQLKQGIVDRWIYTDYSWIERRTIAALYPEHCRCPLCQYAYEDTTFYKSNYASGTVQLRGDGPYRTPMMFNEDPQLVRVIMRLERQLAFNERYVINASFRNRIRDIIADNIKTATRSNDLDVLYSGTVIHTRRQETIAIYRGSNELLDTVAIEQLRERDYQDGARTAGPPKGRSLHVFGSR